MRKLRMFFLAGLSILFSVLAVAQIKVRDHRTVKGDWKPVTVRPILQPVTTENKDNAPVPVLISSFRVDPQFRDEINFQGYGWGAITNNTSQVFFSNKLSFGNGGFSSTAADPTKELMFFTDTLVIYGNFDINLANNKNVFDNGFVMIACRVLKYLPGARLKVDLAKSEQYKYRKFYFFTEQVFMDNKRVYDEAKAISEAFTSGVYYNGHWRRLSKKGEDEQTSIPKGAPPGLVLRPGFKFVSTIHNTLDAEVGFLPGMQAVHNEFYNFFSKWVAGSYQNLYDKIIRDINRFDKIPVVKDYIKFLALNNYDQLETTSQALSTQWIIRINEYKPQIFKSGYQFERSILVDGKTISLVGSVTGNGIVNYLPPSFILVNPTLINGRTVSGFHVFDETQPDKSTLDFDVIFYADSRLKSKIATTLLAGNDIVSPAFEEIQFSNMSITGPDIVASQTKVTPLSNSGFNIRLVVNNSSTLLFNRLFSLISSDIFLKGKWSNKAGDITGTINIPVTFSKMSGYQVEAKGGSLSNRSNNPVVVEYFVNNKELVELSPALLIEPDSSFSGVYTGEDKNISLPPDGISVKLNPERFGDYFEQIDNSDKLTQELFIENHIPASPADSLSGYLQYVQIKVGYSLSGKTYERKLQLSSANALGSSYSLLIPKSSKEAIPLTISGKAIYENGEYDIAEVKLVNAEAQFDVLEKHLKKQ